MCIPILKFKVIALMTTALFATACGMACETWACPDELDVKLDRPVSSPYTLEVLFDGVSVDAIARTIHCEQTTVCGLEPVRMTPDPSNKALSIRVTTAEGSKVTEFNKISWSGRKVDNCHTCRSATITALAP